MYTKCCRPNQGGPLTFTNIWDVVRRLKESARNMEKKMNLAQWWRFGAAIVMLALVSACATVPAGGQSNPFRQGSVYSHLPHPERENIRILSSGELLYDY